MAKVIAVNISTVKGVRKHTVPSCRLVIDHGIEGDAHAGNWHRQISLLAQESIDRMQVRLTDIQLKPGDFAENITTSGIAVMWEATLSLR
jgi:MOSC domain-containing protein YiiM